MTGWNVIIGPMICIACAVATARGLCPACAASLVPAPDRLAGNRVLVAPALRHAGAAKTLVHRLKYQGVPAAAAVLASRMVERLPSDSGALVPVPRVRVRRWRFGVDSGPELAREMRRLTGLDVVPALRPPLWVRRRAGGPDRRRGEPRFTAVTSVCGAVIVDDVITSGATIAAAAAALGGPVAAVTATAGGGFGP